MTSPSMRTDPHLTGPRTYWHGPWRRQLTIGVIVAEVLALAGVIALLVTGSFGTALVTGGLMFAVGLGTALLMQTRLVAHDDVVEIVGPIARTRVPWTSIERFEIRRWTRFGAAMHAVRRDGSAIVVYAVMELGRHVDTDRMEPLVRELNDLNTTMSAR